MTAIIVLLIVIIILWQQKDENGVEVCQWMPDSGADRLFRWTEYHRFTVDLLMLWVTHEVKTGCVHEYAGIPILQDAVYPILVSMTKRIVS
jgi:hypothetical protein